MAAQHLPRDLVWLNIGLNNLLKRRIRSYLSFHHDIYSLIRDNPYAFVQQWASLPNFFNCLCHLSDAFQKSPFFYHFISVLRDDVQMH